LAVSSGTVLEGKITANY